MYVMSQPPPQSPVHQSFVSASSGAPMSAAAVSYVYTQPSIQRSPTPRVIEAINVNLQQPPPPTSQQHPPSLLHLHFPPPFPPNQPPPPIPQSYQIQYQQIQAPISQTQTQFVLQSSDESQLHRNQEQHRITERMQFEGQPPPHMHLQGPPPPQALNSVTQSYLMQESQPSQLQQPPLPIGEDYHRQEAGPSDSGMSGPQPVPPPRMVPPPAVDHMQHSVNLLTSVPPPTHAPPPQAPWLYPGQQLSVAQSQPQFQVSGLDEYNIK